MSIFKDTLHKFVQNQIEARKIIVSQLGKIGVDTNGNDIYKIGAVPRDERFLRFTTGKNAWVKLQSFVDFDGKIGNKTYNGSALARKYVLEGGTLFEEKNEKGENTNKFSLRSGVGRRNSVYASDIDVGGSPTRPLGYRPMPGITSIQINNKSAYGSLREATVKFYAWDKHQLEELELLYMRTGFSVLLEWGWSQYLTSDNLTNISIENFTTPTIDVFKGDIFSPKGKETPDEIIYDKIDKLQEKTFGNYDAMLGYVKNFSWQLLDNGGFECTTILISKGEVTSTLRVSSNGPSFTEGPSSVTEGTPPLSLFESLMLNYTALINEKELTDTTIGQFGSGSSSPITGTTKEDLKNDIPIRINATKLTDFNGNDYGPTMVSNLNGGDFGKILLTEGNIDGIGVEFIKMDNLIALLNLYFNYKNDKNRILNQIIIPRGTPCLASVDSVSIDPTICIIYNSQAKELTGDDTAGFLPKTLVSNPSGAPGQTDTINTVNDEQFLINSSLGNIGNIFVSIPGMLRIYRGKGRANTDVTMIDFLKDLLNQISKALGGINDFQLHTTKNTIQIIDVKYLEQGKKEDDKYLLDLLGLESVCRDVRIQSRIFESQSTMMAISAQSKANVGDLYSSTQVYLNRGLNDRLSPSKVIWDTNSSNDFDELKKMFSNLTALRSYLSLKCTGLPKYLSPGQFSIIYPTPEEISNAASIYKSFQLQMRGENIDYKAIIPFELEITLDGISGLVQGQIFRVDTSILPQQYAKSQVGFIITGIQHSLQNNDWVTTIKTQVCLLDPPSNTKNTKYVKDLFKRIKKLEEKRENNIIVWLALADYMVNYANDFYNTLEKLATREGKTITEYTSKDALRAYQADGASVLYGNDPSNNRSNTYFVSPYETWLSALLQESPENTWQSKNSFMVQDANSDPKYAYGSNKFGNMLENKRFEYITAQNFQRYYERNWKPGLATRVANGALKPVPTESQDAIKAVNKLSPDLNTWATSRGKTLGVGFSIYIVDNSIPRFLAYPVTYSDLNFNSTPIIFRDFFMLRDPNYVGYTASNTVKHQNDGSAGYPTAPTFSLSELFTEKEITNRDGIKQKFYYYNSRPSNDQLFNLFYRYIVTSDFFSGIDPLFKPSASDIGKPYYFSMFHL